MKTTTNITYSGLALFFVGMGLAFVQPCAGASFEFVQTGDLITARRGHTATLLPNGNVRVAGGFYMHDLDPEGIPQFGLVAEDVEKVNSHLVARDEQGKPYTVRYDAVNAMLLNEFLKEHHKVAEQQATISELKAELRATAARQQKQIEVLTAALQKVSARLELSKSAPQTALNNQ